MTISRSSALSINVLLIFEMHDLYGALFLNATFFSALLFSFVAAAKTSPLWATFLEVVFKESSPISNNCFLYFLANNKNPYPLTYFLFLGSVEYRRFSIN